MKRALLMVPALALALAACAPAASTASESDTAPAAEEPAESTAAAQDSATAESAAAGRDAAFPVGHLRMTGYRETTADAVYNVSFDWPEGDEAVLQLWKVDLATAQRDCPFTLKAPENTADSIVVYGDNVCVFANDAMYQVPQDGGEARVVPLGMAFTPDCADEYSAYDFDYTYPDSHKRGVRLDLATGELTPLQLPGQTQVIYAVGTDRFVLLRLITEVPLPDSEDWEQFEAVCQNATAEYDWYDPATGELEKIWAGPYYGEEQEDGTRKRRSLLGMAGDRLYFDWFAGDGGTGGTESCAADGTGWQSLPGQPGSQRSVWCYFQNGSLRWLMGGAPGSLWIYDLADGQVYDMPHITEANGWPEILVGQGQVMVSVGTEPGVVNGFAIISMQDYLAGSTSWTPIEEKPAGPEV